MTRKDKTVVKIKEFAFSIAKESGKVTATGAIEISDIVYNEDLTVKTINRKDGNFAGAGFTVSEAFINMLDDIEETVRPTKSK